MTEPTRLPTAEPRRAELRGRLAALDAQIRLKLSYEINRPADVDDWAQIIHLRVLQRIDAGEDFQNFEAWVRGFIPFVVKEHIRGEVRSGKHEPLDSVTGGEESPAIAAALEEIERTRFSPEPDSLREILDGCEASLRDDERAVYRLRWGPTSSWITSAAAAAELQTTVAALDKRASRIRRKLEECCRAALAEQSGMSGKDRSLHLAS